MLCFVTIERSHWYIVACPDGYTGDSCHIPCPSPSFGPGCQRQCHTCSVTSCHHVHGCSIYTSKSLKVYSENSFYKIVYCECYVLHIIWYVTVSPFSLYSTKYCPSDATKHAFNFNKTLDLEYSVISCIKHVEYDAGLNINWKITWAQQMIWSSLVDFNVNNFFLK